MKKTFYIGLLDKEEKIQKVSIEDAMILIIDTTIKEFGGGTVTSGVGVYSHNDGQTIKENAIVVTTTTTSDHQNFINIIKLALNQESIGYEQQIITMEYL